MSNSLLVRHFPSWLRAEDKESLLKHFGAKDVAVMSNRGKMKNCVFATFVNEIESKWAMSKLHQLEVFGNRLVVEYANPRHIKLQQQDSDTDSWACNKTRDEAPVSETGRSSEAQPTKPPGELQAPKYLYPPPTPATLTNITHTLACVPQFYIQVLHLMNKMNLPPPFGEVTPVPPLLRQTGTEQILSSAEDSELSSDENQPIKTQQPKRAPKRRLMSFKAIKNTLPKTKKPHIEQSTEYRSPAKKIELNIPTEIIPREAIEATRVTFISDVKLPTGEENLPDPHTQDQGAGEEEGETSEETLGETFITTDALARGRLSQEERMEYSVFNKYSPGEPSMRLYIKNLAKHVQEQDLRYIFGRYIDWTIEKQVHAFDIRLMQSGRMKGQAFIELPSEEQATRALRDTNGYRLHDKPMVVQFGRSTKLKESSKS